MNTRKKFFKKNWFIYLMLFVFPPVGIILLWIYNQKSAKTKTILSVASAIWLIIALSTSTPSNDTTTTLAEAETTTENNITESSIIETSTVEKTVESTETTPLSETESETEFKNLSLENTEESQVKPASIAALETEPNSDITPISEINSDNTTVPSTNQNATQPIDSDIPSASNNNFDTYNNAEQQQTVANYVLNNNTKKIHYPSCSSVPKIAPHNYATSSQTVEELIAQVYTTCGICFK